jgi:hypothetical protein
VARILEQNIFLISQVLLQRQDVLLSLLNHTLKDSMVRNQVCLLPAYISLNNDNVAD